MSGFTNNGIAIESCICLAPSVFSSCQIRFCQLGVDLGRQFVLTNTAPYIGHRPSFQANLGFTSCGVAGGDLGWCVSHWQRSVTTGVSLSRYKEYSTPMNIQYSCDLYGCRSVVTVVLIGGGGGGGGGKQTLSDDGGGGGGGGGTTVIAQSVFIPNLSIICVGAGGARGLVGYNGSNGSSSYIQNISYDLSGIGCSGGYYYNFCVVAPGGRGGGVGGDAGSCPGNGGGAGIVSVTNGACFAGATGWTSGGAGGAGTKESSPSHPNSCGMQTGPSITLVDYYGNSISTSANSGRALFEISEAGNGGPGGSSTFCKGGREGYNYAGVPAVNGSPGCFGSGGGGGHGDWNEGESSNGGNGGDGYIIIYW